jgi:hypothetical protein
MTTEGLLKQEEITLTYDTWTFDPSVLEKREGDSEQISRFPEEVEELFAEEGYLIFAREMKLFEAAEIDGKEAFVPTGIQTVAIIADCCEDDDFFDDEFEGSEHWIEDCDVLLSGGKALFMGEGLLQFINSKQFLIQSIPSHQ